GVFDADFGGCVCPWLCFGGSFDANSSGDGLDRGGCVGWGDGVGGVGGAWFLRCWRCRACCSNTVRCRSSWRRISLHASSTCACVIGTSAVCTCWARPL